LEITTDELWAFLILIALVVVIAAPILYFTRRRSRRHDPRRARALTPLTGKRTFDLEVPDDEGGSAYLFITVDGDTDFELDVAVQGEVESARGVSPFAWSTASKSRATGASTMAKVPTWLGWGFDGVAFVLAELPPEPCRVRGEVHEGRPGLILSGRVYVPPGNPAEGG